MSTEGRYSFVSVRELRDYMSGIGLDADQASATQDVLDGVQRTLERYCQRKFELKERTEQVLPDASGRLWVEATPIVTITAPVGAVTDGGSVFPTGSTVTLGDSSERVIVTYTGGLDPASEDLADVRLAILRVAAREATTLHSDVLDPNDLEARPARDRDSRHLGWTDEELKRFDRLRRRTMLR